MVETMPPEQAPRPTPIAQLPFRVKQGATLTIEFDYEMSDMHGLARVVPFVLRSDDPAGTAVLKLMRLYRDLESGWDALVKERDELRERCIKAERSAADREKSLQAQLAEAKRKKGA